MANKKAVFFLNLEGRLPILPRLYTKIQKKLAHQTWRKSVTNERMNERTDGTEVIGPPAIPGTNTNKQ